jgi:tryptophan synthase alpha chain
MSRISGRFADLKAQGKKALIPFITAGDPRKEVTVPLMHALVEAGASMLELGVPFSDPMADGPVIQRASERALEHHTSMKDVLAMVADFRKTDDTTPVILMGYLNPVEIMGYANFARAAAEAGVDGAITVDIPPEEGSVFLSELKGQGIDPIFLLAPTSSDARVKMINAAASGFVYYVSLKGVTGAATLDVAAVDEKLKHLRTLVDMPIGVGFGIANAEMAASMSAISDAVIVGSALVRKIEENSDNTDKIINEASALISGMRQAMDAAG